MIAEYSEYTLLLSVAIFGFLVATVQYLHAGFMGAAADSAVLLLAAVAVTWAGDMRALGNAAPVYTPVVRRNLLLGVALFIVSEVMIFAGMFWSFFHSSLNPTAELGAVWPPAGLEVLEWQYWPSLSTALLVYSGFAVNVFYYRLKALGVRRSLTALLTTASAAFAAAPAGAAAFATTGAVESSAIFRRAVAAAATPAEQLAEALRGRSVAEGVRPLYGGMVYTLFAGGLFVCCQSYEYAHASFSMADGVYGTVFYGLTGLHGAHVIAGLLLLALAQLRLSGGDAARDNTPHVGVTSAVWYWHFVDIVWILLFLVVYVWGNAALGSSGAHALALDTAELAAAGKASTAVVRPGVEGAFFTGSGARTAATAGVQAPAAAVTRCAQAGEELSLGSLLALGEVKSAGSEGLVLALVLGPVLKGALSALFLALVLALVAVLVALVVLPLLRKRAPARTAGMAATARSTVGPLTLLTVAALLVAVDLERLLPLIEEALTAEESGALTQTARAAQWQAADAATFAIDAVVLAVSAFGVLIFTAYLFSLQRFGWREVHLLLLFGTQMALLWSTDAITFLLLLETGNLYLYFLLVCYGAVQSTALGSVASAVRAAGAGAAGVAGVGAAGAGVGVAGAEGAVRAAGAGKTGLEAVFGYFLLNLAGSLLLLLGFGQLYFALGTLHFGDMALLLRGSSEGVVLLTGGLVSGGAAALLSGLALKLGLAPFHIWLAGLYERFPTYLFVFGQLFPKLFLLAFALRFWGALSLDAATWPELQLLLLVLGTANLVIGVLGALNQPEFKRVLLYSSLANLGLLFYALAIGGELGGGGALLLLVYVLTTAAASLPLLAVEANTESVGQGMGQGVGENVGEVAGEGAEAVGAGRAALLSWRLAELSRLASPRLRLALALGLLHLSGVPPFALFFAKLPLLTELLESGLLAVAGVALVAAVAAVAYAFGPLTTLLFGLTSVGHRTAGAVRLPAVSALPAGRAAAAAAAAGRRDGLELLLLLTLVAWTGSGVAAELSTSALLLSLASATELLRAGTALLLLLALALGVALALRTLRTGHTGQSGRTGSTATFGGDRDSAPAPLRLGAGLGAGVGGAAGAGGSGNNSADSANGASGTGASSTGAGSASGADSLGCPELWSPKDPLYLSCMEKVQQSALSLEQKIARERDCSQELRWRAYRDLTRDWKFAPTLSKGPQPSPEVVETPAVVETVSAAKTVSDRELAEMEGLLRLQCDAFLSKTNTPHELDLKYVELCKLAKKLASEVAHRGWKERLMDCLWAVEKAESTPEAKKLAMDKCYEAYSKSLEKAPLSQSIRKQLEGALPQSPQVPQSPQGPRAPEAAELSVGSVAETAVGSTTTPTMTTPTMTTATTTTPTEAAEALRGALELLSWPTVADHALLLGSLLCSGALVALLALVGRVLGSYPRMAAHNRALTSVYECGFAPFEGLVASSLFLFYRLAVFFVVFEAELLLLYPWAAALLTNLSAEGHAFFYAPAFFIGALLYGFVVEVEAEALDL